jgi:hypothetical protein
MLHTPSNWQCIGSALNGVNKSNDSQTCSAAQHFSAISIVMYFYGTFIILLRFFYHTSVIFLSTSTIPNLRRVSS